MNEQPVSYQTVLNLALKLSRAERARLIAQLALSLVEEPTSNQPTHSPRGMLESEAPSAEEIDEAPREDIG